MACLSIAAPSSGLDKESKIVETTLDALMRSARGDAFRLKPLRNASETAPFLTHLGSRWLEVVANRASQFETPQELSCLLELVYPCFNSRHEGND